MDVGLDRARAIAAEAVAAAMVAGADAAEVFVRTGPGEQVTWRGPDLVVETSGPHCEVLVRVWRGGWSLAVTATTIAPELRDVARSAVAGARSHGEELTPCLREGPADLVFPAGGEEPPGEPGSLTGPLATVAALPELRHAQVTAVWSRGRQWSVLVNSRDLAAAYESVHQVAWLWADWPGGRIAEAASGGTGEGVLAAGRRLAGLASLMRADPGPPPTGTTSVLLGPAAAAQVARALGGLLIGSGAARGLRPLMERRGGRIGSSGLDLTDAPRHPGGMRSRPIDDEGTPTRELPLLRAGRLVGLLHTLRTARELGDEPTGSAHRPALWRPPAAGPSNLRIEPGTATRDHLRHTMGTGVEVVGLGRPGRIQDGTGNFTLTGHGWWVEGGERIRPLRGVPLSANVFELLRGVRGVGEDLEYSPLADGAGAPTLLLDRVQVG